MWAAEFINSLHINNNSSKLNEKVSPYYDTYSLKLNLEQKQCNCKTVVGLRFKLLEQASHK